MMASLIFALSIGALVQFALSYCRTLLLHSGEITVSKHVQEIAGLTAENCLPSDFDHLMQLIRFAPQMQDDAGQMRAITAYYRLARIASAVVSPLSREASQWFQAELSRCTYFAAVALDRRLASATK